MFKKSSHHVRIDQRKGKIFLAERADRAGLTGNSLLEGNWIARMPPLSFLRFCWRAARRADSAPANPPNDVDEEKQDYGAQCSR